MIEFIIEILNILKNGDNVCLVSIIAESGSTPRGIGSHMIVCENGSSFGTIGGGAVEYAAQKAAKACLEKRESSIEKYSLNSNDAASLGMVCGGNVDVKMRFISASSPSDIQEMQDWLQKERDAQNRAWIFGAGHVGIEVVPVLDRLGFYTIILDDRDEFLFAARSPKAKERRKVDLSNPLDGITLNPQDYAIIVTRGHKHDYDVLKAALRTDAKYIGMIGSRKKIAVVYDKLRNDGFSQDDISRVHAPIGISLGGDTPEEIAISIAAEIIRVRSGYVEK